MSAIGEAVPAAAAVSEAATAAVRTTAAGDDREIAGGVATGAEATGRGVDVEGCPARAPRDLRE